MGYGLLQQELLGNTVQSLLLFIIILFLGLLFKRIFSRLLSKLLYRLFGRFDTETNGEVFVSLLLRPVELLILYIVIYMAINQLNFPLYEIIFTQTGYDGGHVEVEYGTHHYKHTENYGYNF